MTQPRRAQRRGKSADSSLMEADKRTLIDGLERDRRRKSVISTGMTTMTPPPVKPLILDEHRAATTGAGEMGMLAPVGSDAARSDELNDGGMNSQELANEVVRLREELRLSHATNALLENELYLLEHKALDAIAEAGLLRQKLNAREQELAAASQEHTIDRIDDMKTELDTYRNDSGLLTRALLDSESEVTKLLQNMELFTRRFCVME